MYNRLKSIVDGEDDDRLSRIHFISIFKMDRLNWKLIFHIIPFTIFPRPTYKKRIPDNIDHTGLSMLTLFIGFGGALEIQFTV